MTFVINALTINCQIIAEPAPWPLLWLRSAPLPSCLVGVTRLQRCTWMPCWTHLVRVHFDRRESESHCGQRHQQPVLVTIKHVFTSFPLEPLLNLKSLPLCALTYRDWKIYEEKCFADRTTKGRREKRRGKVITHIKGSRKVYGFGLPTSTGTLSYASSLIHSPSYLPLTSCQSPLVFCPF